MSILDTLRHLPCLPGTVKSYIAMHNRHQYLRSRLKALGVDAPDDVDAITLEHAIQCVKAGLPPPWSPDYREIAEVLCSALAASGLTAEEAQRIFSDAGGRQRR